MAGLTRNRPFRDLALVVVLGVILILAFRACGESGDETPTPADSAETETGAPS